MHGPVEGAGLGPGVLPGPCAAANRVRAPVATTTAVALPEATLLPWKHSWDRSKSPPPASAPSAASLATGADSPVSTA